MLNISKLIEGDKLNTLFARFVKQNARNLIVQACSPPSGHKNLVE